MINYFVFKILKSVLIIPTNVSSTATCVLCYLFLLYRIYKSHSKPHILKTLSRARKKISLVGLNLNSFIRTCKNNGMQRLLFINYKMIYMDYTKKKISALIIMTPTSRGVSANCAMNTCPK